MQQFPELSTNSSTFAFKIVMTFELCCTVYKCQIAKYVSITPLQFYSIDTQFEFLPIKGIAGV